MIGRIKAYLLTRNNINHVNYLGYTPLEHAIIHEDIDVGIIKILLKKGADVNLTLRDNSSNLSMAIHNDRPDIVSLLLEYGANLNLPSPILFQAVRYGNIKIIELLLDYNVDINARNFLGTTALSEACEASKDEIVLFLINRGAIITSGALSNVVRKRRYTIVKLFLEKGADVNEIFADYTPLDLAVQNIDLKMIFMLILNGARIDTINLPAYTNRATRLILYIQNLDTIPEEEFSELFEHDPWVWTHIAKLHSKRAFDYLIGRYSILLKLPKDVVREIF